MTGKTRQTVAGSWSPLGGVRFWLLRTLIVAVGRAWWEGPSPTQAGGRVR